LRSLELAPLIEFLIHREEICGAAKIRKSPAAGLRQRTAFQPTERLELKREAALTATKENPETVVPVSIGKRAITNRGVLNEAYAYAKPSSFSRGMRIDLNGVTFLFISGTASIDEHGNSVHIGDFRAQMRRTLANITGLLESEGCTWHDVVRTTCYLRDIDRDYEAFNEERTAFYEEQGLDPLPASTGIQAILCRPELLVEIEAIAMCRTK
jgi:enamine deaminase RidA (YjgF/YER057c/UK114 family)